MKYLITAIFCLLFNHLYAQKAITNNIKKVGKINIYGGSPKISIGEIIVNPTLETKLYFLKATETKDSLNNFVTTFHFGNNQKVALFGAKINLKFKQPVISATFGIPTAFGLGWELSADKKEYYVKAQQINRDPDSQEIMSVTVVSANRPVAEITGVDGKLSTD